jgi:hypothetical protein
MKITMSQTVQWFEYLRSFQFRMMLAHNFMNGWSLVIDEDLHWFNRRTLDWRLCPLKSIGIET